MRLKLLLLVALAALATASAHDFLKKLHRKDLTSPSFASTVSKTLTHLRRRRDAETPASASIESVELSSREAVQLFKFFVALAWHEDKLGTLGSFLEEMSDSDTNLTLIGWQRIRDEAGEVRELRTVQLVVPPKPEEDAPTNIVVEDDDDDEDWLPRKEIEELREVLEPFGELGVPASLTYEEFDDEGEEETLIYLDKDELYGRVDGFALYNKTSVASAEEVSSFIANLKPGNLGKPSVVKLDVDGAYVAEQSHVTPYMLGSVLDDYEAPESVLIAAPEIIAQISQQYHKPEIPKQLGIRFNKDFPDYKWRVLVDPENYYVTRDVSITLTYDNFDLDENSDISYVVYGVKK